MPLGLGGRPGGKSGNTSPSIVQTPGVRLISETTSRELAMPPLINRYCGLSTWLAIGGNVIVCGAFKTVTVFVTDAAALKLAFPAWLAVTPHVPAPVAVRVVPAIVQDPEATL